MKDENIILMKISRQYKEEIKALVSGRSRAVTYFPLRMCERLWKSNWTEGVGLFIS